MSLMMKYLNHLFFYHVDFVVVHLLDSVIVHHLDFVIVHLVDYLDQYQDHFFGIYVNSNEEC